MKCADLNRKLIFANSCPQWMWGGCRAKILRNYVLEIQEMSRSSQNSFLPTPQGRDADQLIKKLLINCHIFLILKINEYSLKHPIITEKFYCPQWGISHSVLLYITLEQKFHWFSITEDFCFGDKLSLSTGQHPHF